MQKEGPGPAPASSFKIRTCVLTCGERLPLVIGPDSIPCPLPNQWALLIRRPQVQYNTIVQELGTIAHIYDWAERRGINLDERLASGNALRPDEMRILFANLRYQRKKARAVADLSLVDVGELKVVSGSVHISRVRTARDYLLWATEHVLFRLDVGDPRGTDIRLRCQYIRRVAAEYERGTSDRQPSREGLDPERRHDLLELIAPLAVANPFARRVRFRNYVTILLMFIFGYRRGEILKLYVVDVNTKGPRPFIRLSRRPGDPNDPRGIEPAVKTLGREILLGKEMAKILDIYIQRHRPGPRRPLKMYHPRPVENVPGVGGHFPL